MSNHQDSPSAEAEMSVKTVLVVEDDEDIGSFFVDAIKQETSHQALLVTDGYQALKVVHDIKPSLFLLDYSLPRMNGLELYNQLHATKGLEDVPALLITASVPLPRQEVQKCKITCLKKPIELDELLQTIEKLLA